MGVGGGVGIGPPPPPPPPHVETARAAIVAAAVNRPARKNLSRKVGPPLVVTLHTSARSLLIPTDSALRMNVIGRTFQLFFILCSGSYVLLNALNALSLPEPSAGQPPHMSSTCCSKISLISPGVMVGRLLTMSAATPDT